MPTAPLVEVAVVILSSSWLSDLPRARALVKRAAIAAVAGARPRLPRAGASLSVALSDDRHVRSLNRAHRGKDRPTNVLSYPADAAAARGVARPLGDVVLAFETVRREAHAQRKTLAAHLTHLVVHGTLHLRGHDHIDDEEAEWMEALERRILAGLGIADPYG
jgi:probable rRNA maturation factor